MDKPYDTLFERYAFYKLPDGTDVQAVWSGDKIGENDQPPEPYRWMLIPDNRPHTPDHEFIQYEVLETGQLLELRYPHFHSPDPPKTRVVKPTIDDLHLEHL